MSQNGLVSGIDATFKYVDENGVENFQLLESFTYSENSDVPEHVSMDGTTRFYEFRKGWKGTAVFERNNNVLDNYIALKESDYYLGADQLPGTITFTIKNSDGTVSQLQFTNVVLVLEDGGMYSGTDIVKQTVTMFSSRRITLV